jgi:putative nucleotidyltransferase with HDIG domain
MAMDRHRTNETTSDLFRPYMLLVSVVGYTALGWMSVRLAQEPRLVALLPGVAFFAGLAVLVGLSPVRLFRGATVTVGFAVDYASLLIFGPALAAWIGVLSYLVLLRRSAWLRQCFNHGQLILSMLAAGGLYQLLGGQYFGSAPAPVHLVHWHSVFALLGGGGAYFAVSSFLISGAMALWEPRPVWGMWALSFRWAAPRYLALAPFGLLMALVYRTEGLGVGAVALFLVPLVGARYAFQGAMEMLQVHRETVQALSRALEAYDPYTQDHSDLVTGYALQLGKELGLTAARLEALEWAGRLHDIGKCRQDWEPIIRKPGRPSEQEWLVIRQHPIEGARLAEKMEFLPHTAGVVARIVRAHHERWDGQGYPDGIGGEDIPLESRILGVADAYEAMTGPRAYQRRRTPESALQELQACAGAQFDPGVVAAMAALFARGALVEPDLHPQLLPPIEVPAVALVLRSPQGEAGSAEART